MPSLAVTGRAKGELVTESDFSVGAEEDGHRRARPVQDV